MEHRNAADDKCHNAEPGTYGHECGKPAVWVATKIAAPIPGLGIAEPYKFTSSFCDDCRQHGHEARQFKEWRAA